MTVDILSRAPISETDTATCDITEQHINYILSSSLPVAVTLDELRHASESDPVMSQALKCIESNRWIKKDPLKPYYQIRNKLSVKDSIILKGNKLVIPPRCRQDYLN